MPHVTIAVPTHNGERFLGGALERALEQTYADREVLVVDDASTDGTLEVARGFADRGVEVVANAENAGIGGNWNRCIGRARGDLIVISHQDDLMAPDFVSRTVDALEAHPEAGFAHTNIEQIDDAGQVLAQPAGGHAGAGWAPGHDRDEAFDGRAYFELLLSGPALICCPTVVMRREVYERVGRYREDLRYSLDLELYLRALVHYDVVYLAAPLLQYRRHDAQQTARVQKAERYAERIRAKSDGLAVAEPSGRFRADAIDRMRRSVARDCCEAARRYVLGDPAYGARYLEQARGLARSTLWTEDGITARLRLLWARSFGPTRAGRARGARTGF